MEFQLLTMTKLPRVRQYPAILVLSAVILAGCQKVVSVDLNQSNPQVVIEGVITDHPGPYTVTVEKTGDYFTPGLTFPPVADATVVVTDNAGTVDTLRHTTGGTYQSTRLAGAPGRTYMLKVTAEGKEYDAMSSMPFRVRIDTLYTTPLVEFDGDRGYNIMVVFTDPPGTPNWYRIEAHTTTVAADSLNGRQFILFRDNFTNGAQTTFRIRAARRVHAGDTLTVRLCSIDKATYDYYRTVNDVIQSDRSPLSVAPGNPSSNITNGSLGYFTAYAVDSATVILP
ncbi:MAG TPA: DUF4249 domain-containing protein [Bacteroidota bacterium]